jgi:hypothetical protein
MKCWNSAFYPQGSTVVTVVKVVVVVQVGTVKIYVAPVEALRKKDRGEETQFTTQMMMKPCPTKV